MEGRSGAPVGAAAARRGGLGQSQMEGRARLPSRAVAAQRLGPGCRRRLGAGADVAGDLRGAGAAVAGAGLGAGAAGATSPSFLRGCDRERRPWVWPLARLASREFQMDKKG